MMAADILLGIASEAGSVGGASYKCLLMIPETFSEVSGRRPESIS